MEEKFTYHVSAQFHQHDRSIVELEHGAPRTIHFSAPPEFGGEPGFWTPEHFLIAALASCFVATFKGVARNSNLEYQGIEVGVEGILEKDVQGLRFTKLIVRPVAIIFEEQERERTEHLLEKVQRICLVAHSLSGTIELEPKILVESPVTV